MRGPKWQVAWERRYVPVDACFESSWAQSGLKRRPHRTNCGSLTGFWDDRGRRRSRWKTEMPRNNGELCLYEAKGLHIDLGIG
jgi:hypothetical protein